MKKLSKLFYTILLCGLILMACSSANQPSEPPAGESNATEAPALEPGATEALALEPGATEPAVPQPGTGAAVQHTDVPASPSASGGERWGDYSTVSSQSAGRALIGDRFSEGKFERPYNANTMDVYFPQLDIDHAVFNPEDPVWVYVVMSMVGRDANNSFAGQYAVELDLDQYGHGDFLILVDHPASTDWTTQGVWVYADSNVDVGGQRAVLEDSVGAGSNGFETVLFDQGAGADADLAWVRLDPIDPNSFQIAFKQSLLGGEKTYTAGFWAGTQLDAALFDFNDHLTHDQAGAADPELVNFYPIKGLSELDNTCRQAVGFDPSGVEPGICPVQ